MIQIGFNLEIAIFLSTVQTVSSAVDLKSTRLVLLLTTMGPVPGTAQPRFEARVRLMSLTFRLTNRLAR